MLGIKRGKVRKILCWWPKIEVRILVLLFAPNHSWCIIVNKVWLNQIWTNFRIFLKECMELIYLLLQTLMILKKKCIGKMIQLLMKVLIIKVKNNKNKIENGSLKTMILNYMRSNLKHSNKQNVTSLKNLKTTFVKKLLPKIMSTLKVKL